MRTRVAIVYNEPLASRYNSYGEEKAVLGVLEAVSAVHQALLELDYTVTLLPLVPPLEQAEVKLRALDVDLVFNLFEGFCDCPETEAVVPELLAELGIPCTGCSGAAVRLALDKARLKVALQVAGIPTPEFQVLNPETVHTFRLGYPCIVKPCTEDASHGVTPESFVHDFPSLQRQVGVVSAAYGGRALVEEFLPGREFNATILGDSRDTVLPVSEIAYTLPPGLPRILTFAAKWEPESPYFQGSPVICPADITVEARENVVRIVIASFRLLGGEGYARVDMRMDREGRMNVIEVNPNPDISPGTGAARQAKASGIEYAQFMQQIIELALEKKSCGKHTAPHDPGRQAGHHADTARYSRI